MTDHRIQLRHIGLIGGLGVRPQADRGHAAGVDHALDVAAARRLDDIARAIDVAAIERLRIGRPEAIVGGDVKQRLAALERSVQGADIGQIPDHRFHCQAGKIAATRLRAQQHPHLMSRR